MAGVYCPTCESGVEAAAKFCLSCGHDLTGQGPITATGHDLNQLKEVIRHREDLSMAEKFDMIARVEEGANPILLGIAAPAEGEDVDLASAFGTELDETTTTAYSNHEWGQSPAASAAVRAVVRGTNGWDLIQAGKLDLSEGLFRDAMDNGMEASTHIHDVASGEHDGIDPDAMRAIPVLKPPKRSFCPKCGSDIHANTMLQWRKWRDSSGAVVSMQLEASMETSLIQVAAHYLNVMQAMKDERDDAISKAAKGDPTVMEAKLREKLEKSIRKELEKEIRSEMEAEFKGRSAASAGAGASLATGTGAGAGDQASALDPLGYGSDGACACACACICICVCPCARSQPCCSAPVSAARTDCCAEAGACCGNSARLPRARMPVRVADSVGHVRIEHAGDAPRADTGSPAWARCAPGSRV